MFNSIVIIFLLILSVFIFVNRTSQTGQKPSGERLLRIEKSPNFDGKNFQNTVPTKMDAPPFAAFREMMKKVPARIPQAPIQTNAINLSLYNSAKPDEVIVTWLGHSTALIKINGTTILIDPVFSRRASLFQFVGPKKFEYTNKFELNNLPPIDLVLLSHDHYDHLDYKTIKALKDKTEKFIMPLGVGSHLERWGVDTSKIIELDWWEQSIFNGLTLTATPGRHFTGRFFNDRFKTLWCGWSIAGNNKRIYFSGDSGYFDGFKEIGEKLGPFDLTMIECGQYSQYWPAIHMSPEESVHAAIDVQSKKAMPIHWGKFKLSIHNWNEPPARFLNKANELGLKVITPLIGQTFSIDENPNDEWWR